MPPAQVARVPGHAKGNLEGQVSIHLNRLSRWGLELSLKKTKVMAVGHADPVPAKFSILRGNIETVSCFRNLGSYCNAHID